VLKGKGDRMKEWPTGSGQRIYRILGGRSNVFLVSNSGKRMLIDTSTKGNSEALFKAFGKLGVTGIDYLVLTHAHFDHAANAQLVKERCGARIVADGEGARYLSAGRNEPTGGSKTFTDLIYRVGGRLLERSSYRPSFPDVLVEGIHDLKEFGFNGYIIPTPGHSPHGISIVLDSEIAFGGDVRFGVFPWSGLPPWAYDIRAMVRSWGELLKTGCRLFLPSHGTAVGRSLLERGYEKHRDRN
jgi:glyoxylase-like metal-dependent hydrolase (beta-lactamase superfamily II)